MWDCLSYNCLSYKPVSVIAQESYKNPIAFLERLKEALQKFTNVDLDSYKGQVILKDKFLSQCASDIRIKLQQLQQQNPAASLDEMVQIAINIITEKKRGRPRPRKGKKGKRQGKSRCKCFICRQAGHWAKECPNRDKPPKMACYKCHQLGHWAALCCWDPRASRSSTKPSLTMVQCN